MSLRPSKAFSGRVKGFGLLSLPVATPWPVVAARGDALVGEQQRRRRHLRAIDRKLDRVGGAGTDIVVELRRQQIRAVVERRRGHGHMDGLAQVVDADAQRVVRDLAHGHVDAEHLHAVQIQHAARVHLDGEREGR